MSLRIWGPWERYAWGLPNPRAPNWDYSYLDYYKKAYENSPDTDPHKKSLFEMILYGEASKEFYTPSMKHIKPLVQFDKPNFEIVEPQWELYKVSLSFQQTNGEFSLHPACHMQHVIYHDTHELCV